jgi:hypothetical protein
VAKVNRVRILLLAAWLGVALYFSAVVAPAAFGVLRSFSLANAGEIAGTIVNRSLAAVNQSGVLVGLLLLVAAPAVKQRYARVSFVVQNFLIATVAIACGLGEWVIAARMRELRVAMHGQIDQVPLTDPNRAAFGALHVYSVGALSVAMIAALVVLLLVVFSRERNGVTPT